MSSIPSPAQVVARRRAERQQLLDEAKAFVEGLDTGLTVRWTAVFGSVARGDFNDDSDIDVLVIAEHLPARYHDRLESLGWPIAGRVEPVVWTPAEYCRQLQRRSPIAVEALELGAWISGEPLGT
ncbi:MAG: nucleotidyltransferase domain-containing protein [Egibacteraceae bacterium]